MSSERLRSNNSVVNDVLKAAVCFAFRAYFERPILSLLLCRRAKAIQFRDSAMRSFAYFDIELERKLCPTRI